MDLLSLSNFIQLKELREDVPSEMMMEAGVSVQNQGNLSAFETKLEANMYQVVVGSFLEETRKITLMMR